VILESARVPGAPAILAAEPAWATDLDGLSELLEDMYADAADIPIGPDPDVKWRRSVLLGGSERAGDLPVGWRQSFRICAALHGLYLEVIPNPSGHHEAVKAKLRQAPPAVLAVWTNWAGDQHKIVVAYLQAKPDGKLAFLDGDDPELALIDLRSEVRKLTGLSSYIATASNESIESAPGWPEIGARIRQLENDAFRLTERARRNTTGNGYLRPERMFWHTAQLAKAAEAFRAAGGRIGDRFADWCHRNFAIEVAMRDSKLRTNSFLYEGVEYRNEVGPHVKVDDTKPPNECGRIYFVIDSARLRIIVDHIGLHDY